MSGKEENFFFRFIFFSCSHKNNTTLSIRQGEKIEKSGKVLKALNESKTNYCVLFSPFFGLKGVNELSFNLDLILISDNFVFSFDAFEHLFEIFFLPSVFFVKI